MILQSTFIWREQIFCWHLVFETSDSCLSEPCVPFNFISVRQFCFCRCPQNGLAYCCFSSFQMGRPVGKKPIESEIGTLQNFRNPFTKYVCPVCGVEVTTSITGREFEYHMNEHEGRKPFKVIDFSWHWHYLWVWLASLVTSFICCKLYLPLTFCVGYHFSDFLLVQIFLHRNHTSEYRGKGGWGLAPLVRA